MNLDDGAAPETEGEGAAEEGAGAGAAELLADSCRHAPSFGKDDVGGCSENARVATSAS